MVDNKEFNFSKKEKSFLFGAKVQFFFEKTIF